MHPSQCAGVILIACSFSAHAQTAKQNASQIDQAGSGHVAETVQQAITPLAPDIESIGRSHIRQTGADHTARVEQGSDFWSAGNQSSIDQSGDHNNAEVRQGGFEPRATSSVTQAGSENDARVSQHATGSAFSTISQVGDGNVAEVIQSGFFSGPQSVVDIAGSQNEVRVGQVGGHQSVIITGDGNRADVDILVRNRTGFGQTNAELSGNDNRFSIDQRVTWGFNGATVGAFGDGNEIHIGQFTYEGTVTATIDVDGNDNRVDLTQGGQAVLLERATAAGIAVDGSSNVVSIMQTGPGGGTATVGITGDGNSTTLVQN